MIDNIIQLEWQFFQEVNHIDGRAECQDNYPTFYVMRASQFKPWYEDVLASYLKDLQLYREQNRNPVFEKYGIMMKHTDPEHYENIKQLLPIPNEKQRQLMEMIIALQIDWKEKFHQAYPNLDGQARIIHSSQDSQTETSFETYLRGELYTYSEHTLYLYGQMVADMVQKGLNLTEEIMKATILSYGYQTLAEADKNITP